jgi:hypothetical protein
MDEVVMGDSGIRAIHLGGSRRLANISEPRALLRPVCNNAVANCSCKDDGGPVVGKMLPS